MVRSVRDGGPSDYGFFARLFPALGVPDPVPSAAQFEEHTLPLALIAEEAGAPVGYAHWRLYGETAHVVHVIVEESARGKGVGRALLDEVRRRVTATGGSRWYLNVKSDNAPAIRLYERAGLAIEQRGWALRAAWSDLLTLSGSATAVRFAEPTGELERFAREHGIDPERLAQVRGRPGVVFVALRDLEKPVAFAAFDPAFPGIYPIAAASPEYGRPLFEALRTHARDPFVNIFVEGNATLAQALRDGGAVLSFEILRMGASLAR
jgi:GNAT superfamily N-acetyltransferase